MVALKLILLTIALLGIGVLGFAIKLFFKKGTESINTSCGAANSELMNKGVDVCVSGGCSEEQIETCKTEGRLAD